MKLAFELGSVRGAIGIANPRCMYWEICITKDTNSWGRYGGICTEQFNIDYRPGFDQQSWALNFDNGYCYHDRKAIITGWSRRYEIGIHIQFLIQLPFLVIG